MPTKTNWRKQGANHKKYHPPTCGELKGMPNHALQWSLEDEITVLDKLFQFSGQNAYFTSEFYNSVQNMLSIQLSENQLCYMIYCLRNKYLEHEPKEGRKDLDSHTLKVLELSKKIWALADPSSSQGWLKTKVLRDHYRKSLQVYVVEELGFEVDCLTSSVMEKIKKEWEDFQFVEKELRKMQHRLYLELCELKSNMHYTQLAVGHKFRRKRSVRTF